MLFKRHSVFQALFSALLAVSPGFACIRYAGFQFFWPLALRSKRKQLSFFKRCAASVALCFFAVRARRQAGASRFGFRV